MLNYKSMPTEELKGHAARMKIPGYQNMKQETLVNRVTEWVGENGEPADLVAQKAMDTPPHISTTQALLSLQKPAPQIKHVEDIQYPIYEIQQDFTMSYMGVVMTYKKGECLNSRHHNTGQLQKLGAMLKEVGKG
jgi:hypothetical protein